MRAEPEKPPGETSKPKHGFAAMSIEERRKIASMGGKAVPAEKRTFSTNPALARAAGAKGGERGAGTNRSFSRDPTLASATGRKGGQQRPKKPNA